MNWEYLTLEELRLLHDDRIREHGGEPGVRDLGLVESALAQPQMTFGGEDLYPTLAEKAAALCYSLAENQGFVDGNKRIAFAALEAFLRLNGFTLGSDPQLKQEAYDYLIGLAERRYTRDDLEAWIERRRRVYDW
jgi:death-on-curing protein